MLEVADALRTILAVARPLHPSPDGLRHTDLLGRVLAEDVRADLDSPPFTKSLMDGYAVRAADCPGVLRVVGEVAAGAVPANVLHPGEAAAIFTGAPIPDGADAVVMKERTELLPEGRVRITDPIAVGKNILLRGHEMTAGEVVLPRGTLLTPAACGLLASVGQTQVAAIPAVRVGILATGNELVEPSETPGPGKIRNSNGPMLTAQARRAGAVPTDHGIGRDDPSALAALIRQALDDADVLLLAGGVSVGKYDLVPDVLKQLGIEVRFHHVRMKPGKPLLFGTLGEKLVFGLPGNPVSAFVGFELFVRPALEAMSGREPGPHIESRPLVASLRTANDRPTYHPAFVDDRGVTALPWFGSADLRGLLNANALLALPVGEVVCESGEWVDVIQTGEPYRVSGRVKRNA